jgi:hypothetical protein
MHRCLPKYMYVPVQYNTGLTSRSATPSARQGTTSAGPGGTTPSLTGTKAAVTGSCTVCRRQHRACPCPPPCLAPHPADPPIHIAHPFLAIPAAVIHVTRQPHEVANRGLLHWNSRGTSRPAKLHTVHTSPGAACCPQQHGLVRLLAAGGQRLLAAGRHWAHAPARAAR